MSITVLSEREATLLTFPSAAAIISISSPRRQAPELTYDPGTPVLRLCFSDAVIEDGQPRVRRFARGEPLPRRFRCVVYSDVMARRAAEFVQTVYPAPLYIHCLGGISRSAGMAKAIGEFLGEEVHYGPIADPNPLVYERTRMALAALPQSAATIVWGWQARGASAQEARAA